MVASEEKNSGKKIAVVLIRGFVKLERSVKDTLNMLRLSKKNTCVLLEDNPITRGMIIKVKDLVSWGEVDQKIIEELVAKRGKEFLGRLTDRKEKYSYKTFEYKGKKYLPYFHLNPPRKGFGRKGVKLPFKVGGALGNRGEKINDLITRML